MSAQAPCPPDSALMKAWKAYQATEDFTNSFYWATTKTMVRQECAEEHGITPEVNHATEEQRQQYVKGSLWASFVAGFEAAGGQVRF